MSSFTEPLQVTDLENGFWRTERSFRYYVGSEGSEDFIDVLKGYISDFFSVPVWLRWLLPRSQETGNQCAVLHDKLYDTHERTRKESDRIFLESMKVKGIAKWKRGAIYYAVRLFGNAAWKRGDTIL